MFMFEKIIPVLESDIDILGHVNNLTYLRWVQDIAVDHSISLGLDFEAYQRLGGIFVVRRHQIEYLKSVLPGGEVLARTWIISTSAAKYERGTEFWREGELVTRASTTWAFIDSTTSRPTRIPQEVWATGGLDGSKTLSADGTWKSLDGSTSSAPRPA
jgi:acyl-CoA thioester hydrolase